MASEHEEGTWADNRSYETRQADALLESAYENEALRSKIRKIQAKLETTIADLCAARSAPPTPAQIEAAAQAYRDRTGGTIENKTVLLMLSAALTGGPDADHG